MTQPRFPRPEGPKVTGEGPLGPEAGPDGAWAATRRWLLRVGLLLVTVLVVEFFAARVVTEARRSWTSAGAAVPLLLVLGLLAELASTGCFSRMSHVLLPSATRPRFGRVLAVDVAANGFSHVVPGGAASAGALRLRLLGREGVPLSDSAGTAALESAVSVLWLVVAFVAGVVLSVPDPRTHPFLRTAAVLALLLVVTSGGLIAVLAVRPDLVLGVTTALGRRVPLVQPAALERLVRALLRHVHLVLHSPARRTGAVLWGLGTWSCDAASLYLCVWAFGAPPGPGGLLTAYALVALLALLPVTPGGLGIVEGVAVPVLLSFGAADDAALLGVLAWRLFAFWLPLPLGAACYLWLRTTPPTDGGAVRPAPGRGRSDRSPEC